MTDTTRDLIQRMANALNEWQLGNAPPEDTSDVDLINEADAFLAQPEPEGLTDEELETDFLCWYKDRYSTAYFGAVPLAVLIAWTQFVLARWGRPAVKPEPVSEKPWEREGWCDSDGWCWVFDADDTDPCWIFHRPKAWICWTHVLPHYALPVPTTTETP